MCQNLLGTPQTTWCTAADPTICGQGRGCFIYTVDGPSQSFADAHGVCIDIGICLAAGQSYPGGAKCVHQ